MSDDYQQALLTTQYLLGRRETALGSERVDDTNPATQRQLAGLRHADRRVRAEWLARGLQALQDEVQRRRYDAAALS